MTDQLPYWQRLQMIKQGLLPKECVPKEKKPIKKVSDKRKEELAKEKEVRGGGDSVMDLFFEAMRKRMTGRCLFCQADTMKKDDDRFHFSIAHLLPKRPINQGGFPSVGTNENNWIELCFWGNDCHGNFDRGIISWEYLRDSKEWEIIREKLLSVLPLVAPEERKHKLYGRLIELVYK